MKKWIAIIIVILALIIWGLGDIYHDAMAYKEGNKDAVRETVLAKYDINKINWIDYFHGEKAYYVVQAELENGKNNYIWVPDDPKSGKIFTMPVSSGYTKDEILKAFKENVSYKEIISTHLGITDGTPVWEITYIDDQDQYVFSYFDFRSGESVSNPIVFQ